MRAILLFAAAAIVCSYSLGAYGTPLWDEEHGLWASEQTVLTRDGAWADEDMKVFSLPISLLAEAAYYCRTPWNSR